MAGTSQFTGSMPDFMDGLAFDGSVVLYGHGQNTASLYTINPASGGITLIGSTGLGTSQTTSAGLAFRIRWAAVFQ